MPPLIVKALKTPHPPNTSHSALLNWTLRSKLPNSKTRVQYPHFYAYPLTPSPQFHMFTKYHHDNLFPSPNQLPNTEQCDSRDIRDMSPHSAQIHVTPVTECVGRSGAVISTCGTLVRPSLRLVDCLEMYWHVEWRGHRICMINRAPL